MINILRKVTMINLIILVVTTVLINSGCSVPLLWPQPHNITYNNTAVPIPISPCDVNYKIDSPLFPYIESLIKFYFQEVFQCPKVIPSNYTLNVMVSGKTINMPLQRQQESYSLILRENGRWQLSAKEYTGFLRGFETYSQLFKEGTQSYVIQGIPITIDDKPDFKWRGLMIDSARHFLPVTAIKKTINGLMFNKMNILHWHVVDQDSFPLQVPALPELSHYGRIGGIYTQADVREITNYARSRGVRVVVEIDTPAHTHSWGRNSQFSDTVVKCNNVYTGQFDPTLNLTYDLVYHVMNYVDQMFNDPYIHFGGDQTSDSCWNLKPSILDWMKNNNISDYKQLSTYYRKRQKTLWRNISVAKKSIYWANQMIDLPLESDDVLQWWGQTASLAKLANRTNEVILSSQDVTYLDMGFGNRNGIKYGTYIRWRQMYKFNPNFPGVNVIGGETCLWSQLSSPQTHEQKVWIRSSVLAERLWNQKLSIDNDLRDVGRRLVAHTSRIKSRGFKTSAVTVQLCEQNIELCF